MQTRRALSAASDRATRSSSSRATAARSAPSAGRAAQLGARRLGQLGRASHALLSSLDEGPAPAQGTGAYIYLGERIVRGWAFELVLISMVLPFAIAVVDLFARCRRRRIR